MIGPDGREAIFYVGTYTEGENAGSGSSRGMYRARLNTASGELSLDGLVAEMRNPTFLVLNADRSRVYALGEIDSYGKQRNGVISSFAVEDGTLTLINEQSSGGAGPAHISLDRMERMLLVANYGSGSVASLPIRDDGGLEPPSEVIQHHGSGPVTARQDAPHAHSITADKENRFALAADLGTDEVRVYRLDLAMRKLESEPTYVLKTPPGSGPRHLAFGPAGRTVYVSAELSSELLVYEYDAKGSLHILQQISTLPPGFDAENATSEVAVHPSGRFVYVGNRGHDSIAVFVADPARTLLPGGSFSSGGHVPRHFALDPSGKWLVVANQKSDAIVAFRVEQEYGELEPVGGEIAVPAPVCVKFV